MAYELEKWLPLDKPLSEWTRADLLILSSSPDGAYIILKFMDPEQVQELKTIIHELTEEFKGSTDLLYNLMKEFNGKLSHLDK